MTPEQAAIGERNRALTVDMLKQAHLVTNDASEQAMALITAATVLIEREVGTAMAPAALMALVEPSLQMWEAQADRRAGNA